MFPPSAALCKARLASFGGQSTYDVEVRLGWGTPSNRGDVDSAYSIIRSVPTSAQAGITWGVPVARAERVTDSGGRGSWSLDWREDVGPARTHKDHS